jgi:DNA-binding transcriptional LysR family regulator
MELRQLKIFVMVAEEGVLPGAAQKMGYAQTNLTTRSVCWKRSSNTKLFERLASEIALTARWRDLLLHAKKLLQNADKSRTQ